MDAKKDYSMLIGRISVNVKLARRRKAQKKHRLHHCPEWYEVRREIPEVFRKARTSEKEWKWQRGVVEHPLSGSQWNRGHFTMRKWESEKHKSWDMPEEGFKGHVAAVGSFLGKTGKCGACGWSVVQLDYDDGALAWDVWLNGGRTRGSAHHQEGGVGSLLVPPQESMWTHQDSCWTTWE